MRYLDSFLCLLVSLQLVLKVMSSVITQIQGHKWIHRSVQLSPACLLVTHGVAVNREVSFGVFQIFFF